MVNILGLKWGQQGQWERLLFMVALVFAALPTGLSWSYEMSPDMAEGSWLLRVQWTSLFVAALLLARRLPFQLWMRHIAANPFLVLLSVYCLLTILWSPTPAVVGKRMVQFYGVLLIGVVAAWHYWDRFAELLRYCLVAFAVILALSAIFALFVPAIGTESVLGLAGSWRGILDQKNTLGMFSGICLLLLLAVQSQRPLPAALMWFVFGLSLLCLVMCRSSSSATFTVVSVVVYLFFQRDYIKAFALRAQLISLGLLVVCALYLGYYFVHASFPTVGELLSPFSAIFGKSTDLTGRTDIWYYMWKAIGEHPILGLGFGSFWLGRGGPSQFISDELRWQVPSAHNGYLEVINELGYVGLTLFLLTMVVHLRNIVWLYRYKRQDAALHLALLAVYVISNFSESTALRVLTFLQVLMFFSMVMCQQTLMGLRARQVQT